MFELALKSLLSYLLGSLIGALVVGRLRGGVDIRTMGSGNAGGTNALRTQGPWFAFWVMLIDVGKGLIAVLVLAHLDFSALLPDGELLGWPAAATWLSVSCATAAVAGHVFPLWFEFRGGKGAATLLGVLVALLPSAVVPIMLVWILVLVLTGYVGLSTVLATVSFPIYLIAVQANALDAVSMAALLTFGILMTAVVCFTHRSNLARMLARTEPRAQRVWLLRPRG